MPADATKTWPQQNLNEVIVWCPRHVVRCGTVPRCQELRMEEQEPCVAFLSRGFFSLTWWILVAVSPGQPQTSAGRVICIQSQTRYGTSMSRPYPFVTRYGRSYSFKGSRVGQVIEDCWGWQLHVAAHCVLLGWAAEMICRLPQWELTVVSGLCRPPTHLLLPAKLQQSARACRVNLR